VELEGLNEMKHVPRLLLAVLAAVALTGVAVAEYNPDNDIHLRVNNKSLNKVAKAVELKSTGDELFDTQEGAHATATDTTGQEVDHYYIWICLGDSCVPVDPFTASN
jgi:hypothetical protein